MASDLVDADGSDMLTCSLMFEHELDFATDDDIHGAVRRLAAKEGTCSKAEFRLHEMAIGFRHQPHGILLNDSLRPYVRPASIFCHDWMHTFMVHGVFNTLIPLILYDFVQAGLSDIWQPISGDIALWTFPNREMNAAKLAKCFGRKRSKSSRDARQQPANVSAAI